MLLPESVSYKHQQQRGSSSSSGVAEGAASGIDSINCSSLHNRSSGQSLICVAGNPSSKNVTVSAAAARLVEAANGLVNLGTGGGGSQDEIAVSGIPRMCGGSSKILDQSGPNLIVERRRGSRIKDILVKSTGLQKPEAQGKKSWTWSTIPTPAAAVDSHPWMRNCQR